MFHIELTYLLVESEKPIRAKLAKSLAAVALGATSLERHITLDRAAYGSDQAASLEPQGLLRLVRDVRIVEQALGNGVKRVYDSEKPNLKRLRYSKWSR